MFPTQCPLPHPGPTDRRVSPSQMTPANPAGRRSPPNGSAPGTPRLWTVGNAAQSPTSKGPPGWVSPRAGSFPADKGAEHLPTASPNGLNAQLRRREKEQMCPPGRWEGRSFALQQPCLGGSHSLGKRIPKTAPFSQPGRLAAGALGLFWGLRSAEPPRAPLPGLIT